MKALGLVALGLVALEAAAWVIAAFVTKVLSRQIPRRAEFLATQTAQLKRLATGESVRSRLHPILGWDYGISPGLHGQQQNAQGLRSVVDYALEPALNTLRIAVFGDSQVYGGEVDDDGPFPRQLEVGWNVDALNYGVGGYGADQVLLRFREDAPHLNPHVIIFAVTTVMAPRVVSRYRRFQDPADGPWFKPRFVRDGESLRFVPSPVATRADVDRLLENPATITTFGEHDFWYNPAVLEHRLYEWSAAYRLIATSAFRFWKRYLHRDRIFRGQVLNVDGEATHLLLRILRDFTAEARALDVRPLVLFLPNRSEVTAVAAGDVATYAPLRTALEAAQVPTADVAAALATSSTRLPELFAPGGHYTARGNAVVAEALAELLHLTRRQSVPQTETASPMTPSAHFMTAAPPTADRFAPAFDDADSAMAPGPTKMSSRDAYYLLVNVEEHPEVLPLAYDLARDHLESSGTIGAQPPAWRALASGAITSLPDLQTLLEQERLRFAHPWQQASDDLTRRQVLHYFVQYMPTALVDGCWLQCGLRVCSAQSRIGASLTALYAHQVRAFIEDPGRHFVGDYRAAYARLGSPVEEVSSHSFTERRDIRNASFALPCFLLGIGQYARTWSAEILGVNLAWQFLDLSSFGPSLIRDLCAAYGLPPMGSDLGEPDYLDRARELARESVEQLLDRVDPSARAEAWRGVMRGVLACAEAWQSWLDRTRDAAPCGPPDPRQEMLDILWRKAPHASGYHHEKVLVTTRIDDHLDPARFDGAALLDELARSRFVKAGRADRSALVGHLVKFGGPMLAVFSPVELEIMERWINTLPKGDTPAAPEPAAPRTPTVEPPDLIEGRAWTASDFRQRSLNLHKGGSTRDLYHYLINVERHPDILPVAEAFARERLAASMARIFTGERPIPSRRYDPAALERWVHEKHRQQVEMYRPPEVRPPAPREAFIEGSVQLAPIVLIDGGWLQGIATPALIHTVIGRMLFHVLVEEIGAGKAEEHHANVFRDLLAAMGEEVPPVESIEFANWPRLLDASFDVPTLWLSMSCFTRHFLPEILGLNLAVEIAGIGGPYMEARDTLRRFGFPTLFVDVHNAADNVAAGHSAWAMNAIKRYLDEVADREGPHSVDRAWHRVWSGVRATLPQIGRYRLMAHRLRRRFFGEDPTAVPVIFPS